jgi:hypothetical protein
MHNLISSNGSASSTIYESDRSTRNAYSCWAPVPPPFVVNSLIWIFCWNDEIDNGLLYQPFMTFDCYEGQSIILWLNITKIWVQVSLTTLLRITNLKSIRHWVFLYPLGSVAISHHRVEMGLGKSSGCSTNSLINTWLIASGVVYLNSLFPPT